MNLYTAFSFVKFWITQNHQVIFRYIYIYIFESLWWWEIAREFIRSCSRWSLPCLLINFQLYIFFDIDFSFYFPDQREARSVTNAHRQWKREEVTSSTWRQVRASQLARSLREQQRTRRRTRRRSQLRSFGLDRGADFIFFGGLFFSANFFFICEISNLVVCHDAQCGISIRFFTSKATTIWMIHTYIYNQWTQN